ncbi:MAG: hypothetical protein QOJ93_1924, partial [Actinomycetota bacterium]|nr:hypothetical protein [Actinomycetota bacterium]
LEVGRSPIDPGSGFEFDNRWIRRLNAWDGKWWSPRVLLCGHCYGAAGDFSFDVRWSRSGQWARVFRCWQEHR